MLPRCWIRVLRRGILFSFGTGRVLEVRHVLRPSGDEESFSGGSHTAKSTSGFRRTMTVS
jgi:hypothetical protein